MNQQIDDHFNNNKYEQLETINPKNFHILSDSCF